MKYFVVSLLIVSVFIIVFSRQFNLSGHQLVNQQARIQDFKKTDVSFYTTDTALQLLFNIAEQKSEANIRSYADQYRVMVEGGPYPFVWVETQSMGGVMYAKRDLEIAYNNVMIFLEHQREDGRLPGMIVNMDNDIWKLADQMTITDDGELGLFFETLQGIYLAQPALDLYYLLDKNKEFLQKTYSCLKAYDQYLWKYRDSDQDGCLESWSMTDTGEDHLLRFKHAPWNWPFDYPPIPANIKLTDTSFMNAQWANLGWEDFSTDKLPVPMESMDVMGYSYTCRNVLAKISDLLDNGESEQWRQKALQVQNKLKEYLWLPERNAYFYRDTKNEIIPTLTHNNLRMMYYGTMSQQMADDFIREHLLNPQEFWTPVPLPSIAANDPDFRNISGNNWSGQPQGLTYQRAIRALENYGHHTEVTLLGRKLLDITGKTHLFTQQFDPYTAEQNGPDGYGPTSLAVLEYISRMYGVYLHRDTVFFNGIAADHPYRYIQQIGEDEYQLRYDKGKLQGMINGKELFTCSAGLKIATDKKGKILEIISIDTANSWQEINTSQTKVVAKLKPNAVYKIIGDSLELVRQIPFNHP